MEVQPSPRLDITFEPANRIGIAGELDAHTAPALEEAFAQADRAADLVLDGSALTFIDSSGLRVLLDARTAWIEAGHDIVVEDPSPNLSRILEITGLAEHFIATH